ncbi:MAG: amidohydrolase family protein [Candidatus Eisenbacteria bacterium]
MTLDFTLRDVAVRPIEDEAPGACDLVFRGGRLVGRRASPPQTPPRLFAYPGFWDAHMHMLHFGLARQRLDLSGATSLEGALSALEAHAHAQPERTVLWGEGWDETVWPELRPPTSAELDRVVADRPVILRRVCGHLAVLNSRALAQAAARGPHLDPTGVVTEEQAMGLAAIWPPTPAERERALVDAQGEALRMGIVHVSEMGGEGAVDAYLGMIKHGALQTDVSLYFRPSQFDLALRLREEGWLDAGPLRCGGIKAFADGSIGARTAALREPYADAAGCGRLLLGDEQLRALLSRCLDARIPCAIHAIGDAACDQVIGQAERVAAAQGPVPRGWASLEHAELIDGPLLERAARIRLRLSMQPNFIARWGEPGGLYERALGPARWARLNPLRSVWEAGLPLVFGSDGMPMDPAVGLRGAARHPVAGFRLTADEGLAVYGGLREAGATEWEGESPWRFGCDRFVLFDRDPAGMAEPGAAALPARAILRRREWLVPPPEDLVRRGVLHAE